MGILCNNCQNLDGFSSANYCSGNNVVRDYRDGYCAANVCVSSATQPVQQSCNYNNPPCGSGQVCQNNACITPAPTCSNECSSGARECTSNNAYRICGNYDSDSCTEWSGSTSCGSGQVCQNGQCQAGQAQLSVVKNERTGTVSFDDDGCMSNRCYHQTTFTNTGGATGTVKTLKLYSGGSLIGTKDVTTSIPPGQNRELPESSAKSNCFESITYDIKYYDESGNEVGSINGYTCNPP